MKRKCAYWSKTKQGDIGFFQEQLSMLAVEVQQNEDDRAAMAGKGKRGLVGKPKNEKKDVGGQDKKTLRKKVDKVGKKAKKKGSQSGEWTEACLNPDCPESHRLNDCKNTSNNRIKELFDDFYAEQKSVKAARKSYTYDPQPSAD